uniref:Membrane-associated protein n=1 Tax=Macrostomum lignano TaxID=282301 RepID=A0A1I8JNR4_9PLAT
SFAQNSFTSIFVSLIPAILIAVFPIQNCMGTAGMRLLVLTAALLQLACGQIDYANTWIWPSRWICAGATNSLDVLVDSMEAIPLNRQKLWTPQFVFVNVQSVTRGSELLSLKLAGMDPSRRAVVYKQYIRTIGLILANPENQRSIHMSLGRRHQLNCTRVDDQRYSFVYRLSKPFTDNGS